MGNAHSPFSREDFPWLWGRPPPSNICAGVFVERKMGVEPGVVPKVELEVCTTLVLNPAEIMGNH